MYQSVIQTNQSSSSSSSLFWVGFWVGAWGGGGGGGEHPAAADISNQKEEWEWCCHESATGSHTAK
ncbi:hypothetical protein Dimus_039031 [Dionaea muscipula]